MLGKSEVSDISPNTSRVNSYISSINLPKGGGTSKSVGEGGEFTANPLNLLVSWQTVKQ